MARVLLTGANGDVGAFLAPYLRRSHDLRIGLGPAPSGPAREQLELVEGDDVCDLDLLEWGSLTEAMQGVDAVVHLAAQRDFYADWEELRGPNIDGVANLFRAAEAAGVPKVIFASSNHATGGYDQRQLWPLGTEAPTWPDSWYGVTKVFGEALGRYFADRVPMSVICLRIGWVLERPHNEMALRMWLSPADLGRLVQRCLSATVHFGIYYGVSANTRCKYDMTPARRDLGYLPLDDSEVFADEVLGSP